MGELRTRPTQRFGIRPEPTGYRRLIDGKAGLITLDEVVVIVDEHDHGPHPTSDCGEQRRVFGLCVLLQTRPVSTLLAQAVDEVRMLEIRRPIIQGERCDHGVEPCVAGVTSERCDAAFEVFGAPAARVPFALTKIWGRALEKIGR